MKLFLLTLLILFICTPFAVFGDEAAADTEREQSIIILDIEEIKDDLQEEVVLNTGLPLEEITKETAQSDTLLITPHTRLTVVRRDHDYKRQLWMAIGMMTFIVIILGTSQSWNPR
ncbi:MAG: Rpp14/Pop5 family protein [Chitinispirillia bacterium]|nr:Rpp14/Pop5 family protein [Chitinispirillia bacterium]